MAVTIQQVRKLLQGQHTFSQLGFSMLLTRLKFLYANEPAPETLENCAKEINAFLGKYHTVMAADIAVIDSL
ncbi:MAG: hypothetical protein LBI19_01145 [Oscillospiraceae bacterium]|jgi:hypothetical protein|nr:hypothetical protein [Oscillospiraceae bacterium]